MAEKQMQHRLKIQSFETEVVYMKLNASLYLAKKNTNIFFESQQNKEIVTS